MITENILICFFILFNFFLIFFHDEIKLFHINLDNPDNRRKMHKNPTPLSGGIIIILNIIIYFLFAINNNEIAIKEIVFFNSHETLIIFMITSFLIFLVGFIDDRSDLRASIKFILISIIILFIVFFDNSLIIEDIKFSFFEKNFYLSIYSIIFTVFCFLVFLNALNMFDGINLQSGIYLVTITTSILLFYSNSLLIKIFLISILTYSYLNFKNKCFLGDSGALLVAFIVGYLFVKLYNNNIISFADEIVIYMLVPGVDLIRLFFKRIFLKRNPLTSDRFHLHHLLLLKFSYKKTIVILFVLIIFPIIMNYLQINNLFIIIFFVFIYSFLVSFVNKSIKTNSL